MAGVEVGFSAGRTRLQRITAIIMSAVLVAGCASSPKHFAKHKESLTNLDVCRTWKSAANGRNADFLANVAAEADRRDLTADQCAEEIRKGNDAVTAAVVVLGVVAAVAAVAAGSRGGGYPNSYAPASDHEWDWDQFYTQSYQLVWACRGVQTGEFADAWRCNGKAKTDFRWPGK